MIEPAAFAPQPMTFAQKVAHNAEVAAKSGSTYVVVVAGVLGAIYASMSAAQQTTLVETLPFLKGWTPVITLLVAFIVAKLKPSNAVSTQTQQLLDEIARLRLNVFLRSAGSAELPTPTPTPTPVAVPTILPVAVPAQPVAESVVEQEPVTRVDIVLPKIDPPVPVPIDTRLLVSLMLEYLQQTKPPIVRAHNRE